MNPAMLKHRLSHLHPRVWRQHPLLKDPISLSALGIAVAVNILTLLLLIIKLEQVDYPVPTHYLSLVGFDEVGPWFSNYRLVAFSIGVTIVNTALAARAFQRNRLASFFLLIGAATVSILCLVISSAFAEIV